MLKPLILALKNEPSFDAQLIVTGTHLSEEYGNTYKFIEADGIEIDYKIEIPINNKSAYEISECMAGTISRFADFFRNNRYDLLIVLGDRFEIPAFCIAAMNERIPIAHIAGGETTEGALDEAYRHAVTKMSYYHFTTAEVYRKRVIQLGENPNRVFNVGSLNVEVIRGLEPVPVNELEEFLGISLANRYALMTFHPVTLDGEDPRQQAEEVIKAMADTPDIEYICTKANADAGGMVINEMLTDASKAYDNIHLYSSLGQARYLSLMRDAAFVIGNTSSGIGEAPVFNTPTVNVGDRQKGRIRAGSIIDCETRKDSICEAVNTALSNDFLESIKNMENPYGDGSASTKIVNILKDELDTEADLKKTFFDLDFEIVE